MSTTFLALYRGEGIAGSRLLALSADPVLVAEFATRLLAEPQDKDDPVVGELERGRRRALELVKNEPGE